MGVVTRLRARWYLVIVAAILAVVVSLTPLYHIGSGGISEKETRYHVATAQLFVDTNPSALATVTGVAASLGARAPYIAEYATSPSVAAAIAKAVGHPVRVEAAVRSAAAGIANNSPGATVSAGSGSDSVSLEATGASPTIQITGQAGTLGGARAIAEATVSNLRSSIVDLQKAEQKAAAAALKAEAKSTPASTASKGKGAKAAKTSTQTAAKTTASKTLALNIVLRPLGAINAATVVSTPKRSKAILYGVGAFVVLLLVILAVDNLARTAGERVRRQQASQEPAASVSE